MLLLVGHWALRNQELSIGHAFELLILPPDKSRLSFDGFPSELPHVLELLDLHASFGERGWVFEFELLDLLRMLVLLLQLLQSVGQLRLHLEVLRVWLVATEYAEFESVVEAQHSRLQSLHVLLIPSFHFHLRIFQQVNVLLQGGTVVGHSEGLVQPDAAEHLFRRTLLLGATLVRAGRLERRQRLSSAHQRRPRWRHPVLPRLLVSRLYHRDLLLEGHLLLNTRVAPDRAGGGLRSRGQSFFQVHRSRSHVLNYGCRANCERLALVGMPPSRVRVRF